MPTVLEPPLPLSEELAATAAGDLVAVRIYNAHNLILFVQNVSGDNAAQRCCAGEGDEVVFKRTVRGVADGDCGAAVVAANVTSPALVVARSG